MLAEVSYVLYVERMNSAPNSIEDLIGRFGTIAKFAVAIDCGYEAARQMRNRNSISPRHWQRVISASQSAGISGVTYEWLATLASKESAEAQP